MAQGRSRLTPQEIDDLKKHTYFTQEELQQWYKGFLKESPSGRMSMKEFQEIYEKVFPSGDSSKFADLVFSGYDGNKDGSIEFAEYIKAVSAMSRGSLEEKLEWAFNLHDTDKDGSITRGELLNIAEAIYKMVDDKANFMDDDQTPQARVNRIIELMDTDGDDRLSFEEFQEGAKQDPVIVQALSLYDGLV
ncbi:neuronal calcium sensor 1-like isoform X2 [Oscarella lobularis]|uniref:neuronal calcium sensor 1-like isoform X2 n=1 Tax=Oscarella lobularis TaxID=121494 RepID=UPI003313178A